MITCVKCGHENGDHVYRCDRCGHKLQSRRVGGAAAEKLPMVPEPMGKGGGGGSPLLQHAAEVLTACVLLLAALGYGLATGRWWPLALACALAVGLLLYRR